MGERYEAMCGLGPCGVVAEADSYAAAWEALRVHVGQRHRDLVVGMICLPTGTQTAERCSLVMLSESTRDPFTGAIARHS